MCVPWQELPLLGFFSAFDMISKSRRGKSCTLVSGSFLLMLRPYKTKSKPPTSTTALYFLFLHSFHFIICYIAMPLLAPFTSSVRFFFCANQKAWSGTTVMAFMSSLQHVIFIFIQIQSHADLTNYYNQTTIITSSLLIVALIN